MYGEAGVLRDRERARMTCLQVHRRSYEYNTERPHSSLGKLTPEEFADARAKTTSESYL
jgi:transposase InsO family protein